MTAHMRKLEDMLQALGLSKKPREFPIGKLPTELVLTIIDHAAQLELDRAQKVLESTDAPKTKKRKGKKASKPVKQKLSWIENWPILRLGQTNKFFDEYCWDAFFRRTTFDLNLNLVLIDTLPGDPLLNDDFEEGLSRLMWSASVGERELPEHLNGRVTHIRVGEEAMSYACALWKVVTTNRLVPFRETSGFPGSQTIPAEWSDEMKAQYQAGIAGELFQGVTSMTVSLGDNAMNLGKIDLGSAEEDLDNTLDGDKLVRLSKADPSACVSHWMNFLPNLEHFVVEREGHFWDNPSEDGIWTRDQLAAWLRSGDSFTFEWLNETAAENLDQLAYDLLSSKVVLQGELSEAKFKLVRKEERRLKARMLQDDRQLQAEFAAQIASRWSSGQPTAS